MKKLAIRKSFVVVLVIFALIGVLFLAGCNKEEENYLLTDDELHELLAQHDLEQQQSVSEPGVEISLVDDDESPEDIDEAENDPLSSLEVDETWAHDEGGVYLKREEKIYSLNCNVPILNGQENGIGMQSEPYAQLYRLGKEEGVCMSIGDVPIPVIEKDDQIISYHTTNIRLYSAEFIGYSVLAWDYPSYNTCFINANPYEQEGTLYSDITQFRITDKDDNLVEPYRMEYGQDCIVSWFSGTDYNEFELKAESACYRYKATDDSNVTYDLTGELTKDSYAVYDISVVEPGIYAIYDLSEFDRTPFIIEVK